MSGLSRFLHELDVYIVMLGLVPSMLNVYISLMQAQFSQMRPVAMAPTLAPRMPMYPPGAPGLGQQLFYGQAPPAIIPPPVLTICKLLFVYLFFFVFVLGSQFSLSCPTDLVDLLFKMDVPLLPMHVHGFLQKVLLPNGKFLLFTH